MNKIKGKGLEHLIQEGFLNFIGEDEEVLNCLSEDLTLEEINNSISITEKFIEKLYNSMRKLTELENKHLELIQQLEKENKKIQQNKKDITSAETGVVVCSLLLCIGLVICYIAVTSKAVELSVVFGICTIIIPIIFLFFNHGRRKNLEDTEELLIEKKNKTTQEQENILNSIGVMYLEMHISPEFIKTYLTAPQIVQKIIGRLGILLTNLKKFKVIQEDSSLTPSAKMLAISQLFMFLNQSITNAKMLSEQQAMKENMGEKIDQSREFLQELKKQNELLELNTYNKLSELQGHDPSWVAAATYAQLDRIHKEHNQ